MIFSQPNDASARQGRCGLLTFPLLEELPFIRHAFSTRLGGVSQGVCLHELEFWAGGRGRKRIGKLSPFVPRGGNPFDGLVASAQDHYTEIRRVGKRTRGNWNLKPRDLQGVDGLVTVAGRVAGHLCGLQSRCFEIR